MAYNENEMIAGTKTEIADSSTEKGRFPWHEPKVRCFNMESAEKTTLGTVNDGGFSAIS